MKAIWLTVLMLALSVGIVFGEFVNSRDLRALWEAPIQQDVVGFDLGVQIGVAKPDTLRLSCEQVYGTCVDGFVPPGATCEYPFTVPTDGPLSVLVRAFDAAGNVSIWDSTSVIVDTTPPGGCSGMRVRGR